MSLEKDKVYEIEYVWGSGSIAPNAIVIVKVNEDGDRAFVRCTILRWIVRPESANIEKYDIKHTHPFCSHDIKSHKEVVIDDELLAILL